MHVHHLPKWMKERIRDKAFLATARLRRRRHCSRRSKFIASCRHSFSSFSRTCAAPADSPLCRGEHVPFRFPRHVSERLLIVRTQRVTGAEWISAQIAASRYVRCEWNYNSYVGRQLSCYASFVKQWTQGTSRPCERSNCRWTGVFLASCEPHSALGSGDPTGGQQAEIGRHAQRSANTNLLFARASMNVVSLRAALNAASAVGLNDLEEPWLPEQTCSLRKAALLQAQAQSVLQNRCNLRRLLDSVSVFPDLSLIVSNVISFISRGVEPSGCQTFPLLYKFTVKQLQRFQFNRCVATSTPLRTNRLRPVRHANDTASGCRWPRDDPGHTHHWLAQCWRGHADTLRRDAGNNFITGARLHDRVGSKLGTTHRGIHVGSSHGDFRSRVLCSAIPFSQAVFARNVAVFSRTSPRRCCGLAFLWWSLPTRVFVSLRGCFGWRVR